MDYKTFIQRYNKEMKAGVREGRATETRIEAFEKRVGYKLAGFEDEEYKLFADNFEAEKDFLGEYVEDREAKVDVSSISSARPGIPFGSQWYRLETCKLVEVANNSLGQLVEFGNFDVKANSWILVYGGKAEPYTPTAEALYDLVGLFLPDYQGQEFQNPVPKPSDEVVAFFQKYGPLGLFFSIPLRFEPLGLVRLRKVCRSKSRIIPGIDNDVMFLDEYSKLFYRGEFGYVKGAKKDLKALEKRIAESLESKPIENIEEEQTETPRAKSRSLDRVHSLNAPRIDEWFFQGYFEDWLLVYEQLTRIRQIWTEWSKNGNIDLLNRCLRGNIELRLSGEDSVSWNFYFPTLRDAFFGLMAKETIKGKQWRECQNCGSDFWPTHGNQIYCKPSCRQKYNDSERNRSKTETNHK